MKYMTQPGRFFRHLPTYPFIFLAIIPIIILDIWIELYHRISFPFYRMPYARRKNYIKIDRHKLKYLNPMQKLNCVYCGYANGVVKFWTKIFADTEYYWCGIQHNHDRPFEEPEHHAGFVAYNDIDAFNREYEDKRTPGP